MIVLGVAVIAAPTNAAPWSLALLVVAGLADGNAHGIEVPSAANPALDALGFLRSRPRSTPPASWATRR